MSRDEILEVTRGISYPQLYRDEIQHGQLISNCILVLSHTALAPTHADDTAVVVTVSSGSGGGGSVGGGVGGSGSISVSKGGGGKHPAGLFSSSSWWPPIAFNLSRQRE
jgi:hypothetical protein